jgi:hypothetical protein
MVRTVGASGTQLRRFAELVRWYSRSKDDL